MLQVYKIILTYKKVIYNFYLENSNNNDNRKINSDKSSRLKITCTWQSWNLLRELDKEIFRNCCY